MLSITVVVTLFVNQPIYTPSTFLIQYGVLVVINFIAISNYLESIAALTISNKNFSALVDNSDESYILLDTDKRIIMINKTASSGFNQILGYTVKQGEYFAEIINKRELERFHSNFNRALSGKKIELEREIFLSEEFSLWLEVKYPLTINI